MVRQGPARLDPHGPAADDDDLAARRGFPIAPSKFKFAQHGQCGMWVSELLPYTAKMVDDLCFIRSMHTEAINHEPAITLHADRQPDHRPALPRLVGVATASAR